MEKRNNNGENGVITLGYFLRRELPIYGSTFKTKDGEEYVPFQTVEREAGPVIRSSLVGGGNMEFMQRFHLNDVCIVDIQSKKQKKVS